MIFNVKIIKISNMGTSSGYPPPNGQTSPTSLTVPHFFFKGGNPNVGIEDETQVPSRCADWNSGIAERNRSDIGKLLPLLWSTNQKQFSFRWIEHEFVVVCPRNNVTEGWRKSFWRLVKTSRFERNVKLSVISIQMIFQRIPGYN